MKTTLPEAITTAAEATAFLTALYDNGEAYHPEDDAHEIGPYQPNTGHFERRFTVAEADQLNKLFEDMYNLDGNEGNHATPAYDPCEILCDLQTKYTIHAYGTTSHVNGLHFTQENEYSEGEINTIKSLNIGGVFYLKDGTAITKISFI